MTTRSPLASDLAAVPQPTGRHVHLIDTAVASDNVGDAIIVQAAEHALAPLIAGDFVTRSSGHDGFGPYGRAQAAKADVVLMLGTNALSARLRLGGNYMWHLGLRDLAPLHGKVVLLGVGANRDFETVTWAQRKLLNWILSVRHTHSVRDETAARIVRAAGREVLNTSCPTLWDVPPMAQRAKADRVVFTLTKHRPDPSDAALVQLLLSGYKQVLFWPQQPRDADYLRGLPGHDMVHVLPANLATYDAVLGSGPVDVVGTRLHGSIRGLHHGQRALAIEIDNRARDIGAETGLPTITRAALADGLPAWIAGGVAAPLHVPQDKVKQFLAQFAPPPVVTAA